MSAAATAAGYLYASGRLRGRAAREQEEEQRKPEKPEKPEKPAPQRSRERVRVAVLPAREDQPRRTPKIEYRTRKRWSPE